jgi:hypothetical protein
LEEAQQKLRDLASQIRAFAQNEFGGADRCMIRFGPMKASAGLFGLSNALDTY